ncbi:hypothetical protein LC724_04615 [Blautia sp. RD014234]|nr:hypothetical protein [Blautia parvula]
MTLEGRWLYSGYQAEPLCIHLSSRDEDNRFQVDYDYQTQLFPSVRSRLCISI